MTVAADPDALQRFVQAGQAARWWLDHAAAQVGTLHDLVVASCGGRAVQGDALARVRWLVAAMEETEELAAGIRHRLLAADSGSGLVLLSDRWMPSSSVPGRARSEQDRQGDGLNPWLDRNTDSWLVNAVKVSAGSGVSVPFMRRLLAEGPDVLRSLAGVADELGPSNQSRLLVDDPGRFAGNWARFGGGALDAVTGLATAGLGLVLGAVPGSGRSVEALTGRRPDLELAASVSAAGRLLAADPDAFGRSVIGWDEMRADPYRWTGAQAPELVMDALSAGGGAALLRAARLANAARWADRVLPLRVNRRPVTILVSGPDHSSPPSGYHYPDLDVQRQGEVEWGLPGPIVSHRTRPFESPEGWAGDINGGGTGLEGRNLNCVDCSRAVESNWRGQDAVAAPLKPGIGRGAGADLLEDWTGGYLMPATMAGIERRLTHLGPGSSAVVVSRWGSGRAHAYNAVNDAGVIKWVDGQPGLVSTWPPPYTSSVNASLAIFVDPGGKPWQP
jgi:hypothetical protein